MKGMFLGVKVYKLKKPILLGTNIVALLAFCLVTGVILASGGIKVKKPNPANAIAPAVETNNATNITERTATLNGTQLANGWTPFPFVGYDERGFEYGLDTNYGSTVLDSSDARDGYDLFSDSSSTISTNNPAGVAICEGGTYIADTNNNRIIAESNIPLKTIGEFGSGNGQFKNPTAVSCFKPYPDSTFLLVADSGNNRIQVLNITGNSSSNVNYLTYFAQWGAEGTELGQFKNPTGIATNGAFAYIVDHDNNRIQRFEYFGSNAVQWNNSGDLNGPYGIAYSSTTSRLYVTDSGNNRAISFDTNGNNPVVFGNTAPWTPSSDPGKFNNPTGIAVDKNRNVFISDTNNNRFEKFTDNGGNTPSSIYYVNEWSNPPGNLSSPLGIAVDEDYIFPNNPAYVLVADSGNNRALTFRAGGYFAQGPFSAEAVELDCNTTYHYRAFTRDNFDNDTKYGEDKTFTTPCSIGITTNPASNIKMTTATLNGQIDFSESTVQKETFAIAPKDHPERFKFLDADNIIKNQNLTYISQLGQTVLDQPTGMQNATLGTDSVFLPFLDINSLTVNKGTNSISYCEPSTGICQPFLPLDLNNPSDIACQYNPYFTDVFPYFTSACFVSDSGNNRILKFSWNYFLSTIEVSYFGNFGNENGQFNNPTSLAIDNKNNLYVADTNNNRIQKFDSNNNWVETYGNLSPGTAPGEYNQPMGLSFDFNKNRLLIADTYNDRIQQIDQDGNKTILSQNIGLNHPEGLTAGGRLDTIYVADTGNDRILTLTEEGTYIGSYGSSGNGNGEFNQPKDIAITQYPYVVGWDLIADISVGDFILVSDSGNNRIQTIAGYYTSGGSERFSKNVPDLECNTTYTYQAIAYNQTSISGTPGSAQEFTTSPCGMDIQTSPATNITSTIATLNGTISQSAGQITERGYQYGLDTNYGNSLSDSPTQASMTSLSTYKDLGHGSSSIATDSAGNVYTAYFENCKIIKYNSSLEEQLVIDVDAGCSSDTLLTGIDVDKDGNIYAMVGNGVNKYSPNGTLIANLASQIYTIGSIQVDSKGNIYLGLSYFGQGLLKLDSNGNLIDWFISPNNFLNWFYFISLNNIAIDSQDNLIVYNNFNDQITKINTENGKIISQYYVNNSVGLFSVFYQNSLAVDNSDNIYLQNTLSGIQKYSPEMKPIQTLYAGAIENCLGSGEGGLFFCSNIAVDNNNYVYSTNGNLMLRFAQSGTFPTGNFSLNNNQLNACTTYHYRAYGTNKNIQTGSTATYYGDDQAFTTGCPGGGGGGGGTGGGGGGSTTPLSEAPPTTTGAGFLPGTKAPASVAPTGPANPLTNALRAIPKAVAAAISYVIILITLILAILYAIQSYREYQSTKRLNALIRKYQDLQYGGKNFIALTSHYLNTPIGIMQFSSELLVSLGLLTKEGATKVASSIKNIKDSVLELLKQNSAATEQIMNDVDPRLLNTAGRKSVLNPRVWVPLVVAAALLIITDILFVYAKVIRISFTSLFVQIFLFVICTSLLVLAFRSLARNKYLRDQKQKLIDSEKKLMDTKKDFITKTIDAIESDIKELKAISASFKTKKQAEPFMRGLAMIIAVENSFALLNKFAGYQPSGSVNTNDINEVIKNVLTRQDKVVKDKALNIAQNVEPDIAMGLDKSALIVLLGSTIGNAIKFSNNEGTVDINVRKRINDVIITVQDNGLGIAKDKLNSLMMPFTRATDVMKYDYEGIGLGLYMDRIILEQIDGSIKLSSSPGKGTIVRMTIPNNGLAEEATNTKPATSPLSTNPTVRPA